uniref:F-box domain-containing protein n=1 Tax=Setaria italica TaxID=4555 RepID=K4A192_SETIT
MGQSERRNPDGGTTTDDRISGLPDDLLQTILLRLDSTPEAARTSVLARRWRRVWAALPELSFRYQHASPDRVARWLRFASQRLTGELRLSMAPYCNYYEDENAIIVLPPCARAMAIHLDLCGNTLRFGPATAGTFTALATLRMDLPKTRIVAPMLSEVCWHGYPYDPNRHHLVDVGRHLHGHLTVSIPRRVKQYRRFLKNINNVAKCEILLVRFVGKEHAFMSTMLHLLKTCTCIRKLEVFLGSSASPSCPSCCPCRLPESLITDSITLHSLEEVEIYFFQGSEELLELIELLSNNA